MNFIYCRRVYMAYKKEKSKRKLSKLIVFSKVAPLYSCRLVSYQVLYYYRVVISLGLHVASHSIGNLEFIKFINYY